MDSEPVGHKGTEPRIGAQGSQTMKMDRDTIAIHTTEGQQFLDITRQAQDAVYGSGIRDGMVLINSLHTTIALFINEFQDALLDDVAVILQKLIPRQIGYYHDDPRYSDCNRKNAHAHLRATLLGRSIMLGIADRALLLGQYQRVILAELDGPRERHLQFQVVGG
jgi:secondary thiamine-phosphate synthase enzyme